MSNTFNWDDGVLHQDKPFFKTTPPYQPLIDKSDFDGLEAALLEHLDASPQDTDYYLPAYRFFVKRKEADRASALLQLHIDGLREKSGDAEVAALLQAVLGIWPDCVIARNGLLAFLKAFYAASPHYEAFVKHIHAQENPGTETLRLLEAWLRYDEGRPVYMPGKGAGRVKEVNLSLEVLRILFENGEQVSFKIDEAERLCRSLPQEHFLSRKLDSAAEFSKMAEADPGALLGLLFSSVKKNLSLAELREMLGGVVPDEKWAAWWARARKDRRLTVGSGAKPAVTWSDSSTDAEAAIAKQFETASPMEKLHLMQKHAGRSKELAATMLAGLVKDAQALKDSNPSLCLEIALSLDKGGQSALSFSPQEVLLRGSAADIIAGIADRLTRKKAMALTAEVREDWPDIFARLMQNEQDGQALGFLYDSLRQKGNAEKCDKAVSQALSDPSTAPRFYAWLCREIPSRPELLGRANVEFLLGLLRVLDNKAFKGLHASLRRLFDPGEAADKAASTLDAAGATRVLDALNRDSGLEDYRKDRVREHVFAMHPHLHGEKKQYLYVTKEKLEEKREELSRLMTVDIPQNSKEIQRTREYGDLRENFEYHAARHRQEMLSSRAKSLHDELAVTRDIDPKTVDASKISVGTRVALSDTAGQNAGITLTILGPWDSDPAKNILSYTSAAGAALLGGKIGGTVKFNEKEYKVEKIEVWKK
ncbi:MAG TPA: GreA/GreB family elongation factor [Chitinivibrionales bacterium]|nr:GreA/GreB family elongation factor [Chitinivibrionales bacterium]